MKGGGFIYIPFPLGARHRGGGPTCSPLPNILPIKSMARGTPIEANIPRNPPYCFVPPPRAIPFSTRKSSTAFFLVRRHRLNMFVELYLVCPITVAKTFLSAFSAPKLSPALAKALAAGLIKGLARLNRLEKRLPPRWAVFSICVLLILRSTPFSH